MPMYSDPSMRSAEGFGVAYVQTSERYHPILEAHSGEDHHRLPVPSVFLLDRDRTINFQYVHPDHRVRISPDLLLAAARTWVD